MLIVANWKAYVDTRKGARALLASAKKRGRGMDVVLAPPAPYLGLLIDDARKMKVRVGAQDVSAMSAGAHTGETDAALLAELGVSYVIVGHSERREAGETDAVVAAKAQRALEAGLTPILCIGEHERDADATYLHALRAQLEAVYAPLPEATRTKIIVAYEPLWAIGKTAADAIQPHDLLELSLYLRKALRDYVGEARTTILYGGSVEPANAKALAQEGGVDGFLVGHASAEVSSFTALLKALA